MYKERASQMGKIMTNARSKSETLSKTAMNRVQEKWIQDRFEKTQDVWSRYTEKGHQVEDASIELFAKMNGLFGVKKNVEHFENDFFQGTPDIILREENCVVDIKSSWNAFTFPFFTEANVVPTKDYLFQLQTYMDLTGCTSSILAYCLIDTPEDIIQDEIRREAWRHHILDVSDEFEDKVRSNMTFNNIPEAARVKMIRVERDDELIEKMKERVIECREYYSQLEKVIDKNMDTNQAIKKNLLS